jgi:MATE family multidrug resistance protein
VRAAYQALLVAVVAWPLLLLLIPVGDALFPRLGLPASQIPDQIRYFDLLMLGSGLGLLRGALSGFFTGLGRTRVVMLASLISMLTNVGLVQVLVFGRIGLPALGVTGAAIGTLVASGIGVLVLAMAFLARGGARRFGPLPPFRVDLWLMGELLRKGWPSGAEFFLNLLAFQAITLLFQRQGEASATAATIMFNWDLVSFVPLVGIEIGVTSLVGRYVGARDFAAVRRSLRSGLRLGWLFSAVIFVVFVACPGPLVDVFRGDTPSEAFLGGRGLAVDMVRIASLYVASEAILLVLAGALRGAGDTLFTMLATTGLHWVMVAALWITLELLHLSTLTAWIVLVGTFALFPLVLVIRWRSGRWRSGAPA